MLMLQKKIIISRNYANAIFNIAIEDNTIEYWNRILILLSDIIKLEFVKKKIFFSKNYINNFLISVCEEQVSLKLNNLINILYENKRLFFLNDILKEFNKILDSYNNTIEIVVISAFKLDKNISNKIYHVLLSKYSKNIRLIYQIDKSIIGGLILIINNRRIDCSIIEQIKQLNNFLNR
jgi:F-type H+-transporting ATPase subunit delta